jgi:hypothetical protein
MDSLQPFIASLLHIRHNFTFFSRVAFTITDTELNDIAALAIIGLRRNTEKGIQHPCGKGDAQRV